MSTDKVSTTKNLRDVFPKQVPTDIVNCVNEFLHSEIREEAGKLYENLIGSIINPAYVPKETFVERMTVLFVKHVCVSFKDFLERHMKIIKRSGPDDIEEIFEPLEYDLMPTNSETTWDDKHGTTVVWKHVTNFVWNILMIFGQKEGYFEDDGLSDYLESLTEEE
jgi:hypothetical protein